jgi:hypothetical protein
VAGRFLNGKKRQGKWRRAAAAAAAVGSDANAFILLSLKPKGALRIYRTAFLFYYIT